MNKFVICINANIDIDTIEDLEERENLEETIDEEITEGQSQIEYWCDDNECDYDLFENHRCIVTTNSIYAYEELPRVLRSIEYNTLDETYITYDEIEE